MTNGHMISSDFVKILLPLNTTYRGFTQLKDQRSRSRNQHLCASFTPIILNIVKVQIWWTASHSIRAMYFKVKRLKITVAMPRKAQTCNAPSLVNPLLGTLKPQSNGPLYRNTVCWQCCGPAQSPPRCTNCNSPSINGQIHIIWYGTTITSALQRVNGWQWLVAIHPKHIS